MRFAPALFLHIGHKFYLGYPAWQRAGGLLRCALLAEGVDEQRCFINTTGSRVLLSGLAFTHRHLTASHFFAAVFFSRASGTVYTAIDIATGQEVSVHSPSRFCRYSVLSPLVWTVDGAFGSLVDLNCKGCSSEAQTSVSLRSTSAKAFPPKHRLVSAGKIDHLLSSAFQWKLFKGNVVLCLSNWTLTGAIRFPATITLRCWVMPEKVPAKSWEEVVVPLESVRALVLSVLGLMLHP